MHNACLQVVLAEDDGGLLHHRALQVSKDAIWRGPARDCTNAQQVEPPCDQRAIDSIPLVPGLDGAHLASAGHAANIQPLHRRHGACVQQGRLTISISVALTPT